jgi:hypothetical protein
MTFSEANYLVFGIVGPALLVERKNHARKLTSFRKPVSSLRGYDLVQICTAFNLQVANEFLMYTNRDVFEESIGEEKFAEGMKAYTVPVAALSLFVPDDQIDTIPIKHAFEFDDPRFLSQETASSFAKYCRKIGVDDPHYWQKIYLHLGLEYTATSPKGNDIQSMEFDLDDTGIRDHFHNIVFTFSDSIAIRIPHIGDCSILPYQKKTILYAIRWTMDYWESRRETTTDQAIIDRYDSLTPTLSYLLTHLARDWHQIDPEDKNAVAKLNECESFPDWALPLKVKYIDEDTARNEALDVALEVTKDRVAFEKKLDRPIFSSDRLERADAQKTNSMKKVTALRVATVVLVLAAAGVLGGALGMTTVIAYILVVFFGHWCLTIGVFLVGFPIALLLAWSSISLRTKVSGLVGGTAGVALAVAFGYGVFRLVVGPNSFTVGAFLASTVPLLYMVWRDFLHSRQVFAVRQQMLNAFSERGEDVVRAMARESETAHGSGVVGEIVGLVLATAWFFSR